MRTNNTTLSTVPDKVNATHAKTTATQKASLSGIMPLCY